ncbi:MAG: orotate phosphoribosyltransferase [Betaproteobacteria bacterium]|nr:orotate phosphoribosyltransferase [Betaproteobacteria bacterium]NBY14341.1 orotate phosphoribosyltransferase [Betaproteobacteria bacterium]
MSSTPASLSDAETPSLEAQFLAFAVQLGALRFGEFQTKAGRLSPYFFNAGLFHRGASLGALADFYARALLKAQSTMGLDVDVLFGPAYKGIPLASATAVALAAHGLDIGFCFNRKEAKDHGEGGLLVGAPMQGRVLIIDDVISAGTSVRESIQIIRSQGAEPVGVLIALDRMERGGTASDPTPHSAVQEVQEQWGIPVVALATLEGLLTLLRESKDPALASHAEAVAAYRDRWGV